MGGRRARDRGASAVEFAIVLPLLLLVIAGIVDFGRALFTQVILTNAAREGVRAAIYTVSSPAPTPGPTERASLAAPAISPLNVTVSGCPSSPGPSAFATVWAEAPKFEWLLLKPAMNMFGAGAALPTSLKAKAVMQCAG